MIGSLDPWSRNPHAIRFGQKVKTKEYSYKQIATTKCKILFSVQSLRVKEMFTLDSQSDPVSLCVYLYFVGR